MRHSVEDLFSLAYRYYPRDIERYDPVIGTTEEYRRRMDARRGAIEVYGRFRALLGRLRTTFPGSLVEDQGLYHPLGNFDACFSGKLVLPTLAPHQGQHALYFYSSFLAPYYLMVSRREVYIPRTDRARGGYDRKEETRFELTAEEQPYAQVIANEIQATFGGDPLPPAVGRLIVPNLAVLDRTFGHVTINQCLFGIQGSAEDAHDG